MRTLAKVSLWLGGILLVILAAGYFTPYGGFAINGPTVGAGVAAELTCAGVFVSNRKLDDVVKNDILRLSPLTKWNTYKLDTANQSVSVTALGLRTRTAVYRPGVGCTLLVDDTPEQLRAQAKGISEPAKSDSPEAWPKGDTVDLTTMPAGVDRAALDKAVDDSFTDETPKREIDTRAIVVVYDGHIVAERYAPGYDKNTRFLGWSESKSMTSTFIGTLIASGKLALDAPAPVAEWKGKDDKRGAITLRNLLNMSSGLAFSEPYDPGSDSTQMLFQEHDMAAYAASKPLAHGPGTFWAYSSGTANILSRIAFQQAGGTLAAYEAYARARVFDPAGITSAVFEPDESGNFVGSSYLYMTARDWARFGLIYLNKGTINGNRIVPESYADFVCTPAPHTSGWYGGQFWMNGFDLKNPKVRAFPHLPADMCAAEGHNDEFTAIFPSHKAVIVRLGWTVTDGGFNRDKHFAAILAALPKT
ncbi:MAG TPA: serine hydrolase [Rhizomicrobium sp.]|nr:serine hydrolase [Rhizomicrobium sp.]